MEDFIAKFGYTLAWGIGIPEESLEEGYDRWFNFGLSILIIAAVIILICLILVLILWRSNE